MFNQMGPFLVSFRSIVGDPAELEVRPTVNEALARIRENLSAYIDPLDEAKPKLGSGARFKKDVKDIEAKEGYSKERAGAIMASAGMKKYGKSKFLKAAQAGKKN